MEKLFYPKKVTKLDIHFDNYIVYFDVRYEDCELIQNAKQGIIDFAISRGETEINMDDIRYCVEFLWENNDVTETIYARYKNLALRFFVGDVSEEKKEILAWIENEEAIMNNIQQKDNYFATHSKSICNSCNADGVTIVGTEIMEYAIKNIIL